MNKKKFGIKDVMSMSIENLNTGEELLKIETIGLSQKGIPLTKDKNIKIEDLIKLKMCVGNLYFDMYVEKEDFEKLNNLQK